MVVSQILTKIFKSNLIPCYNKDLCIVMIQSKSCLWITKTAKMHYKYGPRFYCNCSNFPGMAGQRKFPVRFPVRICALNLLFLNTFYDVAVCIESRCVIKAKHVLLIVLFRAGKNCTRAEHFWRARAIFPCKIRRIIRPTRHVLLQ